LGDLGAILRGVGHMVQESQKGYRHVYKVVHSQSSHAIGDLFKSNDKPFTSPCDIDACKANLYTRIVLIAKLYKRGN
jgi:hypothetical protein